MRRWWGTIVLALALVCATLAAVVPPRAQASEFTDAYIAKHAPGAQAVEARYRVPASVALAQSILESGWGRSGLSVNAHAYFGIKCTPVESRYQDGCYSAWTQEYYDGWVSTIATFRAYPSIKNSFLDYGLFLTTNARYAGAFAYTHDPDRFILEVWRAGYATDPTYVDKIVSIMLNYRLYRFNGTQGPYPTATPVAPTPSADPTTSAPSPQPTTAPSATATPAPTVQPSAAEPSQADPTQVESSAASPTPATGTTPPTTPTSRPSTTPSASRPGSTISQSNVPATSAPSPTAATSSRPAPDNGTGSASPSRAPIPPAPDPLIASRGQDVSLAEILHPEAHRTPRPAASPPSAVMLGSAQAAGQGVTTGAVARGPVVATSVTVGLPWYGPALEPRSPRIDDRHQ